MGEDAEMLRMLRIADLGGLNDRRDEEVPPDGE